MPLVVCALPVCRTVRVCLYRPPLPMVLAYRYQCGVVLSEGLLLYRSYAKFSLRLCVDIVLKWGWVCGHPYYMACCLLYRERQAIRCNNDEFETVRRNTCIWRGFMQPISLRSIFHMFLTECHFISRIIYTHSHTRYTITVQYLVTRIPPS